MLLFLVSTAFSSTACRGQPAGRAGGKTNRLLDVANSYSNGGQIVKNVFVRGNGYKEIALYFLKEIDYFCVS